MRRPRKVTSANSIPHFGQRIQCSSFSRVRSSAASFRARSSASRRRLSNSWRAKYSSSASDGFTGMFSLDGEILPRTSVGMTGPLGEGDGLERQGVDVRTEQIAQGLVDHPVLLQDRSALEGGRNDEDVEVPAAARGAGVALVPVALVAQLEVGGMESLLQ